MEPSNTAKLREAIRLARAEEPQAPDLEIAKLVAAQNAKLVSDWRANACLR